MRKMKRFLSASLAAAISFTVLLSASSASISADAISKPVIVVSLGDSYSAGEGIEPFYNQNLSLADKIKNEDWLAHRSTLSWPSQLVIPGVNGTMKDYDQKDSNKKGNSECRWYFTAVSGAKTEHFDSVKQDKSDEVCKIKQFQIFKNKNAKLPLQLSIFDNDGITEGSVDYVTMSVGGNDANFADVVKSCINSTYLHQANNLGITGIRGEVAELILNVGVGNLDSQLSSTWAGIKSIKRNLKRVYLNTAEKAGPQATIIVAGYPKLFDKNGKGVVISKKEASDINKSVTAFNKVIEDLVNECRIQDKINIYYVDVETAFNGHEAYTYSKKAGVDKCWINPIIFKKQPEDLSDIGVGSSYSVHPNKYGAMAYARCVNDTIAELGILSGKAAKALDHTVSISGAKVTIYKDDAKFASAKADSNGEFQLRLPEGDYKVIISADGYNNFAENITITRQETTNLEAYLMDNPVTFDGHTYELIDEGLTWDEAEAYCESRGGHLATITSAEEEAFIENLVLSGSRKNYWLGGTMRGSDYLAWITGEEVTYTNWANGQPDHDFEDCLMIYNFNNPRTYGNTILKWNDLVNEGTFGTEEWFGLENFGLICEWEE